jgi:hypothetical protein
LFSVEFCNYVGFDGLVDDFRFRHFRHDDVAAEAARSAVQAQEPKTSVVPSGMLLASLDLAIEFADELTESPT